MSLDTKSFVSQLIAEGYTHLCVVPCSFVKNLINEAINNQNIEYLPAASEAVACSIGAGLKIAGKKPIIIVQSSGLANMASCVTSLLKPYGIKFPILSSWRSYKEGDSEIQHKHLATNLPKLIDSYGYSYQILDKKDLSHAITQIRESNNSFNLCIIQKDTFDRVDLNVEHILDMSLYPFRSDYLRFLDSNFKDETFLFLGTTGNTSREMYAYMQNTKNFYMAGNMGGALSVGYGIAKSGKKVIVCGGDAEFVMQMGGLTTVGRDAKNIDLIYILFDNEQNKSTGGQNTYQGHLNYTNIAKNCGFNVHKNVIKSISDFELALKNNSGLFFLHVKCNIDETTPRPPIQAIRVNELK